MRRIMTLAALIGVLSASLILQAIAAEPQRPPGAGIAAPRPLTIVAPFSCPPDKTTCSCKSQEDCGEMGRLGVCKAGTFTPDGKGGGSCTRKQY